MTLFRLLRGIKTEAVVGAVDVGVGVVVVCKNKLIVFGKRPVFFCRYVAVRIIAVVAIPCVYEPVGVGRVVFVIKTVVQLGFRVGVTASAGEVRGAGLLCHVPNTVKGKVLFIFCNMYRCTSKALYRLVLVACPLHSDKLVEAVVGVALARLVHTCVVTVA